MVLNKKITTKQCFTLIELLVVVAIIGILAAVVLPTIGQAQAKARDAKRIEELRQLRLALQLYYLDNNYYPVWTSGCIEDTTTTNPFNDPALFSRYMKQIPQDPLYGHGHCYYYKSTGTGSAYHLIALLEKGSQFSQDDGGEYPEYYEVFSEKRAVINEGNKEEIKTEVAQAMGSETQSAVCGNGIVEGAEECDDGDNNSDTEPNACRTNCKNAYCGDNVKDKGEECDPPGTLADGLTQCSDTCQITPGPCSGLDGIVSYWKAEGNADDPISGNNGTFAANTYVTGQVGQAFSFDGANDYVDIPYDLEYSNSKTFVLWVNLGSLPPSNKTLTFVRKREGNTSNCGYQVSGSYNASPYDIHISYCSAGSWREIHSNKTFSWTDEWVFLGYVFDWENKEFTFYIKPETEEFSIIKKPISVILPDDTANVTLGWDSWTNYYMDGKLDEVAVYNRALTADEIKQHYQNGLVGKGYCQP